jgi:two-component system, OmpR family, response regulator RegX3
MAQVMVIEELDEPRARAVLAAEGLDVEHVSGSIELVLKAVEAELPKVVLVETTRFSRPASRVCATLQGSATPVALLCRHATEREVIAAYTAGADAVIVEPVGRHELVARIRALLRRVPERKEVASEVVTVGPIAIDRARRQLTVHGEVVPLPRKEFDIAELLISRAGTLVPRVQITRELWGSTRDTKTLDVQVGRLRAKLVAAEGRQRIITVRGVGYRFASDDDLARDEPAGSVQKRPCAS